MTQTETIPQKEIIEKLSDDRWRVENLYSIQSESGEAIPFKPNRIQNEILDRMFPASPITKRRVSEAFPYKNRRVILKYRQGWVSTLFIIITLDNTLFNRNRTNYFVAHREDLLSEFFRRAKFAFDNMEPTVKAIIPKPKLDNSNELFFAETNSTLRISLDVRGKTPTYMHVSELAWMEPEKQKKLYLAMDSFREAEISIESTAKGRWNVFFNLVNRAKNWLGSYDMLFFPWFIEDRNELYEWEFEPTTDELQIADTFFPELPQEKKLGKLAWRRRKIEDAFAIGEEGDKLFRQENPATPEEAFVSDGAAVFDLNAIKCQNVRHTEEHDWIRFFLPPQDRILAWIDIAEGWIRNDFSTIRGRTLDWKLAFSFKGRVTEQVLAEKVDMIFKKWYLFTLLIENNVGLAFINECKKYPWFHWVLKQRKDDSTSDENLVQKYGFRTTEKSKDLIVREYRAALWKASIDLDDQIRAEIETYEYDNRGRPNAISPNHDDLLMADMICWHGILTEPYIATRHEERIVKPLEDMTPIERLFAKSWEEYE